MASEPKDLTPPGPSKTDHALSATKAALSAIPVVGGPASELFAMIITPPLTRRRDAWMTDVAEALSRVEAVGRRLDDLVNDDAFVTTVLQASRAALRTHEHEKRRALRNAVMNAALRHAPPTVLQGMFIALVDEFTGWHLQLLALFGDTRRLVMLHALYIGHLSNGAMATVLEKEFPDLRGQKHVYTQVIRDLFQRGLLDESVDIQFGGMRDAQVVFPAEAFRVERLTWLGKQFLSFIADPSEPL